MFYLNNIYVETIAKMEDNPVLVIKGINDFLVTSTPGYNQKILVEDILDRVVDYEEYNNFNYEDLGSLKSLVSYILDLETKEEILYRLKSIENLLIASKLIDEFEEGSSYQQPVLPLKKIDSLINSAMLTPFRDLLEKKYSNLIKNIKKDAINTEIIIDKKSIYECKSPQELNDLLCEIKIKEFINIGNAGRCYVSDQVFKNIKQYESLEKVKEYIIHLSNNYAEQEQKNEITKQMEYSVEINRAQYQKLIQ